MPKDKPGFLQNIGDDQEEKEIMSVLENEEKPEEKSEEKIEEKSEEKPEGTLTEGKPEEKSEEKIEEKSIKKEINASKTKKTSEEKPEKKPLIMGKYKTVQDLEKAYAELQRAFTRLTEEKSNIPEKAEDKLNVFRRTAVIRPVIPDPSKYYFKNENNEDVLDLEAYMKDAFNNFSIATQQSLLGGPLAAAVFSMLQQAINEEYLSTIEDKKREENAVTIWNNIQKEFPVLSKSEALQELFEKAIYGEKYRRLQQAQANNTEYVDLTEEDYMDLARKIVGSQPKTMVTPAVEPVETIKSEPTLTETRTGISNIERQINKDIDDMMATKSKQLF